MTPTLTSIAGNSLRLDGGAMFGNAPKALWSRWMVADERNRISMTTRALLVQEGGRNILLEAGIGVFFAPNLRDRFGVVEDHHVLLESLQSVELSPSDIHIIVLSHLHFDHAGGLLNPWKSDESPSLAFPNARYVVGAEAWQRATKPHFRDRASFIPELQPLLQDTGRLELVDSDRSASLGDGFCFRVSHGHTPGLLLTEVNMPAGPVVFCSDLIPASPWVHLPITMGYDRFPEKLIEEKQLLLEDMVQRNGRLFFTHDSSVALAGVSYDGRKFQVSEPSETITGLAL